MKRNCLRLTTVFLFMGLLALTGCNRGPQMGIVTGKITVDGQPIKGMEVNFSPVKLETGTTATGYTQADGSYKLVYPPDKDGAPVGDYKVSIAGGEGNEETGVRVNVPAKYNKSTELTASVKPGTNNFDFELKSK